MQSRQNSREAVHSDIRKFIVSAFLFGNESALPNDESSLVDAGIIDSTGVLELIEFLEEEFEIVVLEAETVPENLGDVAGLTNYVLSKLPADETAP